MSKWKNRNGKTVRRDNNMAEQWAPRPTELLKSPVMRVLSRIALLCLARIEIELRDHGGYRNGNLIITKQDFVEYCNCKPRYVAPALRELEALGIVKIKHGRGGNQIYRTPNMFLINFLCGAKDDSELIDETAWRCFKTMEQAKKAAAEARQAKDSLKVAWGRRNWVSKKISRVPKRDPVPGPIKGPESPDFPGLIKGPTGTDFMGPIKGPTLEISGGGGVRGGKSPKKRRSKQMPLVPGVPDEPMPAGLRAWTTPTLVEIHGRAAQALPLRSHRKDE